MIHARPFAFSLLAVGFTFLVAAAACSAAPATAPITVSQIDAREKAKAGAEPITFSRGFLVELGRELHERHIRFQALPSTSDPAVFAQRLDLGLASFATDSPDVARREIKACDAAHAAVAP